jgi:hypothetical protein
VHALKLALQVAANPALGPLSCPCPCCLCRLQWTACCSSRQRWPTLQQTCSGTGSRAGTPAASAGPTFDAQRIGRQSPTCKLRSDSSCWMVQLLDDAAACLVQLPVGCALHTAERLAAGCCRALPSPLFAGISICPALPCPASPLLQRPEPAWAAHQPTARPGSLPSGELGGSCAPAGLACASSAVLPTAGGAAPK